VWWVGFETWGRHFGQHHSAIARRSRLAGRLCRPAERKNAGPVRRFTCRRPAESAGRLPALWLGEERVHMDSWSAHWYRASHLRTPSADARLLPVVIARFAGLHASHAGRYGLVVLFVQIGALRPQWQEAIRSTTPARSWSRPLVVVNRAGSNGSKRHHPASKVAVAVSGAVMARCGGIKPCSLESDDAPAASGGFLLYPYRANNNYSGLCSLALDALYRLGN
jgi:hypothetical protein